MLDLSKFRKTFFLGLMGVFVLNMNSENIAKANSRNELQGETNNAYIQTMDRYDGNFKAKVKIKSSGTYYVIAGFIKGKCWHKGSFSGVEFFRSKVISGDAGDVLDVSIDNVSLPPLNRDATIGVFTSLEDICTKG